MDNIENRVWAHRRALGAPLRPPFGASRLTPASAPPHGPGGVPRRDFQCCPPIVKKRSATQHGSPTYSAKRSATQHGSPSYSAKSTLLSQKQRRYAYDSDVYAKNSTYLAKNIHICYSFVIILKFWDRQLLNGELIVYCFHNVS